MIDHVIQAKKLLKEGQCALPVTLKQVAEMTTKHPDFTHALISAYRGKPRLLNLITEVTTVDLCNEAVKRMDEEEVLYLNNQGL